MNRLQRQLIAGRLGLSGNPALTRTVLGGAWLHILVGVLGAFEVLMAVSAGPGTTVAVGLIGGLALMAAPWPPIRMIRMALLLIGTVPFAALVWWSGAGPLLAVVALGIGVGTLRRRAGDASAPAVDARPEELVTGVPSGLSSPRHLHSAQEPTAAFSDS
jgi:hypothetical protein